MANLPSVHKPSRGLFRPKPLLFMLLSLWFLALGADALVFLIDPPEILGWGERPSLRQDILLGWRLIESKTTRLRWRGYDYVVESNSLGFPGPDYPEQKPEDVVRIMTVGGGFTSAEGVNTMDAWPRVLERTLNDTTQRNSFEVLNFAVTGFGPEQYARVVTTYAPIFRPDVVLVTLIPNDLAKVTAPIHEQAQTIGFNRPQPGSPYAFLTCRHLNRSAQQFARNIKNELILGVPDPDGYFFGQLWAFETGQSAFLERSRQELSQRISRILDATRKIDADLVLLLVPASIQVCDARSLAYTSRHVEINDIDSFDLDQPQRLFEDCARELGISCRDLRDVLAATAPTCPYFPNNLHWTSLGHKVAAAFVADLIGEYRDGSDASPCTSYKTPSTAERVGMGIR